MCRPIDSCRFFSSIKGQIVWLVLLVNLLSCNEGRNTPFLCFAADDGDETRLNGEQDRIPDEQRLFDQLLVDCEPAVRPVYDSSRPVVVQFRLGLYQIVGLV